MRQLEPMRWSPRQLRIVFLLVLTLGFSAAVLTPPSVPVARHSGGTAAFASRAYAQEKMEAGQALKFQVPLPITGTIDLQVRGRMERALKMLPANAARPVFIVEFVGDDQGGAGSDFSRALSLADFLSGETMSRVRTVAYLRQSVKGHAVLPVLACEQIIMHKEAELGAAADVETTIDPTVREGYREIASRRRVVPETIALGLLDPALTVLKITTHDGVTFTSKDKLAELREKGAVLKEETLFQPGDPHLLTGAQMRQLGFASHLVDDEKELAAALDLAPRSLQQAIVPEDGWRPVRVDLDGLVHQQQVNWIIRSVEDQRQRADFNLLCLYLNSPGGSPAESVRLARFLASLDPQVHTVALIGRKALADAAIVAFACDTILIQSDAKLGGPGEANFTADQFATLREPLQQAMQLKNRDWSLPLALVDQNVEVFAYSRPGSNQPRYLTAEEVATLDDAEQWSRGERPLDTKQGLSGLQVEELGLGRAVQSLDELRLLYQFEGEPTVVRSNWALALVEWLADPRIAGVLLFVAWFALMFEMSSPGVGLPGFISAVCFLLYFWSQFLHGTAGWLEVLLFVGGLTFVAIELFALPGTGIFGIGGGLMVIASIILASQTFVIPGNAYQMKQFPISLLVLAAGMAGGIVAVGFIRRFLPDTPYFNRMMLKPPEGEELEELSRRESLVSWGHLAGKTGITLTPLVPSGKAQFGDDIIDVISDGELIDPGSTIYVAEVLGNRVIVRRAPGG